MKKVKDLHGQLQSTVTNLSSKIGCVIREREKDFLAAYRHHMYNVQKELQDAKQRVKEAEDAVKNNNQVRKLKRERDWYRNEAIRLDNAVQRLQDTLKEREEELRASREDQRWLEQQVKNSKRHVKLLESERGLSHGPEQGRNETEGN